MYTSMYIILVTNPKTAMDINDRRLYFHTFLLYSFSLHALICCQFWLITDSGVVYEVCVPSQTKLHNLKFCTQNNAYLCMYDCEINYIYYCDWTETYVWSLFPDVYFGAVDAL